MSDNGTDPRRAGSNVKGPHRIVCKRRRPPLALILHKNLKAIASGGHGMVECEVKASGNGHVRAEALS